MARPSVSRVLTCYILHKMTPTIKNVKKMENNNPIIYCVVRLNKDICLDEVALCFDIVSWHLDSTDAVNIAALFTKNDKAHHYMTLIFDLLTNEMRNTSKDTE